MSNKNKKYIFVVGGVMSSVGKGITTASIGKILQARGFKVTALKADPYINVDAGTMNPTEHGEVFVTSDKDETDQDIGNYERFLGVDILSCNYMTTGRIYQTVIKKERNLEYKGKCVEVIPHIPDEIIRRIDLALKKTKSEIAVIEIGGTIGEYQNALFIEAARQMKLKDPENVAIVMVSYLPIPAKVGEMKTKPTQTAARALNAAGVQADFVVCRADRALDEKRKEKIALFCGVKKGHVISAPDVETIYEVPLNFEKDGFSEKLIKILNLKGAKKDLKDWTALVRKIKREKPVVNVGIVGKYFKTGDFTLADSYISVIEALKHAAWKNNVDINIDWLSSEKYEENKRNLGELSDYDGILIPGGFGSRGTEGKLRAIEYVRENKIPYFGLCLGMQLASIEFARNVVGLKRANSLELDPKAPQQIFIANPFQQQNIKEKKYGGTMRLGACPCEVKKGTQAYQAYKSEDIVERHRHRYEFNNQYLEKLAKAGLVISGLYKKNKLVEIVELSKNVHPWFVGVQFHPEFQSRPLTGHPLFNAFIKAALKK